MKLLLNLIVPTILIAMFCLYPNFNVACACWLLFCAFEMAMFIAEDKERMRQAKRIARLKRWKEERKNA